MSRPVPDFVLPPRQPDNRRAGDDPIDIFALKAQGDLFETLREIERRLARLEVLIGRATTVWQ